MIDYQAGQLSDMLKAGKLRNNEEVEETLALARQALVVHAWDDDKRIVRQLEADICLLLDMQRYDREFARLEKLPEIIVRGVQ